MKMGPILLLKNSVFFTQQKHIIQYYREEIILFI